jgi:hypothetical protein
MSNENSTVIEAWNTVLFDKFCRFKHLLIHGLSGHSDEALARHPLRPGNACSSLGSPTCSARSGEPRRSSGSGVTTVRATLALYRLSEGEAARIERQVRGAFDGWSSLAETLGIARREIQRLEGVIDPSLP